MRASGPRRGRQLAGGSGLLTPVARAWSFTAPLAYGTNVITVFGTNSTGVSGADTVAVYRPTAPAGAATATVTASPASVPADGATTSTITVTLKDAGGNPVSGKTVTLASSRGLTDTISAASGPSDVSGVVTFTVKSSTAGSPIFTATDVTDGSLLITQTATVAFVLPSPVVDNAAGASNLAVGVAQPAGHADQRAGRRAALLGH